ncbi:MAG: sulfite exporter TauE/SafE family protein [Bdellovibrionales bacterium]|nr:sulfite exporter TauE/SafE family protein [Bdellovibrionales bacterium]
MSLLAILTASLLGSPHCAGMCGGFVAFYAGNSRASFIPHLSYNLGRLTTYLSLGLLAGFLGQSVEVVGELQGFQSIAALFTGVLLVYWGIRGLVWRKPFGAEHSDSALFRQVKKLMKVVAEDQESSWGAKAYLLGAVTTLLPCGWLYAFLAIAAGTASPLSALLVMFVFWIGTLPVMVTLAGITGVLSWKMRQYVPMVTSLLLIVAGVFAMMGHVGIPGAASHAHHHHHHHQIVP